MGDSSTDLLLRERARPGPPGEAHRAVPRKPGAAAAVNSLRLDAHQEDDSCWLHGADVCLSTRSVSEAHPLDVYAGTFRIGPVADVIFRVSDGTLHAQSPAGGGPLVAIDEDCFEAPGVARMRFKRDADGLATSVAIEMGEQRFEAARVS